MRCDCQTPAPRFDPSTSATDCVSCGGTVSRFQTPGRGGSKPIGAAPRVGVSIRVDADVLAAARVVAGERGLSAWVNRAMREQLERDSESLSV